MALYANGHKVAPIITKQTPTQTKSMTLGASTPTTVTPDSGYALSSVSPNIDTSVIKAANIASGSTILGIAGTHAGQKPEQSKTLTLGTSSPSAVTPDSGKVLSSVPVSIDTSVIKADNIAEGVTILGIEGTHSGGGGSKYGATINGILGDVNASGVLQQPTEQTSFNFTGVKQIPADRWKYKFAEQPNIVGVSFPDLETLGNTSLQNAFYSTGTTYGNITSLSMPNLQTVGSNALQNTFYKQKLTNVDVNLPLLSSVGAGTFASCFYGSGIKSFTTNAITGIANNTVFQYAFQQCTNDDFEVHFNNLASINANNVFQYAFGNSTLFKNKVGHPFPDLIKINGQGCFTSAFIYNYATRMVFDKLEYIGDEYASTQSTFYQAFNYARMGNDGTDYDKYGLFFPSLKQIGYAGTASYRIFGQVLQNSSNRHTLHFYDLTTVNNSATSSSSGQFAACGALRVYMPKVTSLGTYNQYVFYNSSTTQEIHFGIENEETIKALSGYASKFGATNATIYFDMVNHIMVDGINYYRDGAACDLDNWYFAWQNPTVPTQKIYTTNFKDPAVGDITYTKSGDTYVAGSTITAVS